MREMAVHTKECKIAVHEASGTILAPCTCLATGFEWRQSGGRGMIAPRDMATRHLFMTLVLIWNHTLPEQLRIMESGHWKHHLYRLGPAYTPTYLKEAIRSLAVELSRRTDMEDAWIATLDKMLAVLATGQIPLNEELR